MTKKELLDRWTNRKGQEILSEVLSNLSANKSLDTIDGLTKYEGRWDLRGAILSSIKAKRIIEGDGTTLTQKHGTLKLKNVTAESIDFSFTDISYSLWEKCRVSNCLFEETKAKELQVYASDFSSCIFQKVNFSYSFLNRNIGKNSGSFRYVNFVECNLKECIFSFPEIENCTVEYCNLVATNFDGSRFKNCKFIGTVDSAWFSGYSVTAQRSLFGIFNRINPRDYPNPMENIDFSEAELIGVSFINGIELNKCVFPKDDEKYILVENLESVYSNLRKIINKEWEGEEKRKGLAFIDFVLYKPDYHSQRIDLIDKIFLTDKGKDSEFGEKFFALIKKINDKFNT